MVLIGLGSNRGASIAIVLEAMARLERFAAGPVRRSSLWRTSPVDCPPGAADFINAAAAFEAAADLTPEALLAELKRLERAYGVRDVAVRNSPRELDLDLLLYDDERRDTPEFSLPHPRAVQRRFVLAPAAEVLPDVVWPGTGRTICTLLAELCSDEQVAKLTDHDAR
jgi:2-amino-4-hydroxy-6-hydroxymethyldihydropteridine diphosphokinase